jgi:hypothetical protein
MSHKNDPDYHDTRARILLEAAIHLNSIVVKNAHSPDYYQGVQYATKELRRMASVARREHSKVRDKKRKAGRELADINYMLEG